MIDSCSSSGVSGSDEIKSMSSCISSETVNKGSIKSASCVPVNNDVSSKNKKKLKRKIKHEVLESEPLPKRSVCIFILFPDFPP